MSWPLIIWLCVLGFCVLCVLADDGGIFGFSMFLLGIIVFFLGGGWLMFHSAREQNITSMLLATMPT